MTSGKSLYTMFLRNNHKYCYKILETKVGNFEKSGILCQLCSESYTRVRPKVFFTLAHLSFSNC